MLITIKNGMEPVIIKITQNGLEPNFTCQSGLHFSNILLILKGFSKELYSFFENT
jgi:hypothetical protein